MRLIALFFLASLAAALEIDVIPAAHHVAHHLEARARKAVPTRTITRRVTTTLTLSVSGKPKTVQQTTQVTSTASKVLTETVYTTTTAVLAKRTAVPLLEKRAGKTSTVYVTRTFTKTKKIKVSGPTITSIRTVQRVVNTTSTTTNLVTRTVTSTKIASSSKVASSSKAPRPAPSSKPFSSKASSSKPTSSSASKSQSSAGPASTKLPYAYPEIDTPSVFQKHILALHNNFRADFGVGPLTWDTELASFAQKWTDRCIYAHTDTSFNENDLPWVAGTHGSQIPRAVSNALLARKYSADAFKNIDASFPVKRWGPDEFKLYKYSPRTDRNDHVTGHFQNMVWSSYQSIGCAVSYCPKGLKKLDGSSLYPEADPPLLGLFWSCDFGVTNWSQVNLTTFGDPAYNIPRNVSRVY